MKTLTSVFLFCMLFSFLSPKALLAQHGIKVGFRVSPLVSFATIIDDSTKAQPDGLSTKSMPNFAAGIALSFGLSPAISIQTGANFVNKSFEMVTSVPDPLSTTAGNVSLYGEVHVTSVEIPLGLKFRSSEIGTGVHFFCQVGATGEFNISNKSSQESLLPVIDPASGNLSYEKRTQEIKNNDGIKGMTVSVVPAVGVDWEFDWGMLQSGVSYHAAMSSLNSEETRGRIASTSIKLSYVALDLGYFF